MAKDTKKLLTALTAVLSLAIAELGGSAETSSETEKPGDPEPEGITLESLREVASTLLEAGKASDIKAVLKKHGGGAESLTKLDKKYYDKVNEKLAELAAL